MIGFFQALYHLYRYMPDAVFSKGSYAAVPIVLAAWIYRIPIMTQDSDAIPGVANKIMGKFADKIAVAYPSAVQFFESGRVAITGNPVREGILEGSIERARSRYQCSSEKLTLLVLGGSLGSRSMNIAFAKILPKLLDQFFVIHQTGMANIDEMRRRVEELNLGDLSGRYVLTPFMDIGELSDALSLADLIVSRAGANAIAEIAAVGKPSILIPLPSAANDEQHMNAYEIARVGGAVVLEEVNLGENMLFEKITDIMNDVSFRSKMGTAVRAFYHADASSRIAEGVVDLIRER